MVISHGSVRDEDVEETEERLRTGSKTKSLAVSLKPR